jgi:hypothetical protein
MENNSRCLACIMHFDHNKFCKNILLTLEV